MKYKTEFPVHSHLYEGKDWDAHSLAASQGAPFYVSVMLLCTMALLYFLASHCERASKAGKYF